MWSPMSCSFQGATAAVLIVGSASLWLEFSNQARGQESCEAEYNDCINEYSTECRTSRPSSEECNECLIDYEQCMDDSGG